MDLLVIAVADTLFIGFSFKASVSPPGLFLLQNNFKPFDNRITACATLHHRSRKLFMPQPPKSAFMTVRVTDKTRTKFHEKARKIGTPSEVHREIVEAFVEDRLTIQPPVNRNPLEKLYVTRSQD
jgi:hypothetical protein